MLAGVSRDQAELERLVFLRDEGWRTDLNKILLDEDLTSSGFVRGAQVIIHMVCCAPTSRQGWSPLQWSARTDTLGMIWIAPV